METFAWSPLFLTGIEGVDAQHRRLVEITNELGELALGETEISEGRLQMLFKDLTDYAREHFHDEEVLMRRHQLDARHVEPHIRHHHKFVDQLLSMWRGREAMKRPAARRGLKSAAWPQYGRGQFSVSAPFQETPPHDHRHCRQ